MELLLIGIIVGLVLLRAMESREDQKKRKSPIPRAVRLPFPPGFVQPMLSRPTIPVQTQLPFSLQTTDDRVSTRALLQTWRNSVVGLVKLAQNNLANAYQCLQRGECETAIERALTSTENISRALLHCYGEKPEKDSGQEEALRSLALKLTAKENLELRQTIEESCQIYNINIVRKYLATRSIGSSFLLPRSKLAFVLESASKTVAAFSRIIFENFRAEIPELAAEICPRCNSREVAVLGFSETTVNCTCIRCGNSWTYPREQQPSMR